MAYIVVNTGQRYRCWGYRVGKIPRTSHLCRHTFERFHGFGRKI